ncbi:AAA family ATPase [Aureispira anguillae]|uniref:AAA family ATPase n=1 Tax=Aureispira anguillae TaxID=2864201 RepID=A0A916DTB0_9BACT|nr:AAA family ATPase [Aureispira anguillae]BDS12441.1 AAA family ATPase [Aureispira anguillae]
MINEDTTSQAVYFTSLSIEGVNCFKKKQTIDLTDGKGNPAMWTVILGNNNTGKTTLLRCLALLESEYEDGGYSPRLTYFLPTSANAILSEIESTLNIDIDDVWSYSEENFRNALAATYTEDDRLANLIIDAYGTQRKEGKGKFLGYKLENRTESLFKDDVDSIINAEEWFLGIDYNALKGGQKFSQNLLQIKTALISILPDIKDIEINEDGERRVHFITNTDEKVLVNQLGSGYQSLVTWIVDFAKRMFDRYPKSDNPLAEPAIVLVDEIDLHLHPEWQRKIVSFLRNRFPKTQFIVTAHSPLVIQSADDINVVVLQKNEETDEVTIYQPKETNFQGWTVEEILSDLMGMGDKIHSNAYLKWMKQFDKALDQEDYNSAKEAYEELSKIVYSSATLKMLKLQMTSLMPN